MYLVEGAKLSKDATIPLVGLFMINSCVEDSFKIITILGKGSMISHSEVMEGIWKEALELVTLDTWIPDLG